MFKLFSDFWVDSARRVQRCVAFSAIALAFGGAHEASATVIFSNITGPSSPGGYVVGQYSPGSNYALGSSFTVPIGAPTHLIGGSIGVSFQPGNTGLNEMDLEIAVDDGSAISGPVGAIVANAVITNLSTDLTFIDFSTLPGAVLTPGASYWLLASMPDSSATAYWWAANVPAASYPVAVSYNGGLSRSGPTFNH
jgi:hypothetical protein